MIHPSALIRARGLGYRYPGAEEPALRDISLEVRDGEYVAVLGANGSGKSTFLKLLVSLLPPPPGALALRSRDGHVFDPSTPEGAAASRRAIALVMQNPDDQIVASVCEEDVAFGPRNLGLPEEEVEARTDAALRAVGLEGSRSRPPHLLSGGERQRLTIAGALAMGSSVLALDEASSMVDPVGRAALLDLLDRLSSGEGLPPDAPRPAILHVTHSMEDASRASRVIVLSSGRIVFDGTPAALFSRPDLAEWSLELPPALACARELSSFLPDFRPASLDPEGFASELAAALSSRTAPPDPVRMGDSGNDALAKDGESLDPAVPAAGSFPVLEFSGVSHVYLKGTAFTSSALAEVDLSFQAGTTTAVVGVTGSGKSTLLKHGNAVLLPTSGSVRTLGSDTSDAGVPLKPLRLRAPLSVQNPESALFARFVADDVAYGPKNAGLAGRALVEAVRRGMDRAGLSYSSYRDRETVLLSGGERRKAALAGVFSLDAELYLFDEPCAALDPSSSRAALEAVLSLSDSGAAVIATTHSMEDAARFRRVVVMNKGSVVASGAPDDLFYDGYDPSWGISRPWTAETVLALRGLGVPVSGFPLTPEALARGVTGQTVPAGGGIELPRRPAAAPKSGTAKRRRGVGIEFFRNATLGQFLDRPSPLRDSAPLDKVLLVLALGIPALVGSRPEIPILSLLLALAAGAYARIGPRHLLRALLPAAPYLIFISLFQVVFSWPGDESRVFLRLGPLDVTSAELLRSYFFAARMAAAMAILSLFSAVTPLTEVLRAFESLWRPLERFGFPGRDLSAVLAIVFRSVPVLAEEAERIAVAQLSRGGGYEGKGKIRAGMALTVPLFLRALERAQSMASAMELRLYGTNPRTPGAGGAGPRKFGGSAPNPIMYRSVLTAIFALLLGRALYFF